MIRLVIDTNNLPRSTASTSAAFARVQGLIQEGVIKVLLPYIVAEEWRTQQLEHLRKQFDKAREALADLLGGGHLTELPQREALVIASHAVGQITPEALDTLSQQALNRLLTTLTAEVLPITDGHGARVAAAYFRGGSPFSGIKARKDFPDAYLYEAVSDIAGDAGSPLAVVTGDKNLAKHLAQLTHTTVYEDLDGFAQSEDVKALTAEIAAEAAWRGAFEGIVAQIAALEEHILGQTFVNSFVNTLANFEVEHGSIPADSHSATLEGVDDPESIEIAWPDAEDYGPGVLRVPFRCLTSVLLDFDVFRGDAYIQPDFISVQWADPEEHHYFGAQAHAIARVEGHLMVTLDDWKAPIEPGDVAVSVDEIDRVVLREDEAGNALH